MKEDDKQLYNRWLAMWNGNLALADDIISPACIVHQAPNEFHGPEGIKEMVRMGREPFADLTFSVEISPITEGNMLAARWQSKGKYKGGIPGATVSTGTSITFGGMDIMRIEAGKIAEYWVSSDGLHLMTQLGVI